MPRKRYVPTRNEIDATIRYIANRVDFDKWFSVMGGPGWNTFNAVALSAPEIAEWACRLGFMEARWSGGSAGYVEYRITRSGIKHAEEMA